MKKSITVVIPAAGAGLRLDPENPKQFLLHRGLKTIEWTLKAFEVISERIVKIVICLPETHLHKIHLNHSFKHLDLIAGGASRQESVYLGLKHLNNLQLLNHHLCLIHDAARPLLHPDDLQQLLEKMDQTNEAALLAIQVKDTLKYSKTDNLVEKTIPRKDLWQAQTPQGGPGELCLKAHQEAQDKGWIVTDDASILEQAGTPVHLVPSHNPNFKITQQQDWELFKRLI